MFDPRGLRDFRNTLVGAIYAGLSKEAPWAEPLEMFRAAMHANSACLRISQKGAHPREYLYAAGPKVSAESIAEWEARSPSELLPVQMRPGEPQVFNWSDFAPGPTLAEMLRRYQIGGVAVMLLAAEDGIEYLLSVSRDGTDPRFAADDLATFKLVGQHFARALCLRREFVRAQVVSGFQSDALDRLGIAAILVGSSGQLMVLNRVGRQALAEGEGLRVCGGRLHAVELGHDRMFQGILREVLASESGECSRAMLMKSRGAAGDLNLLVSARRLVSPISDRPETCALVFLRSSSVASDADVEVLQELFSFTPAEARLALGLANGKRLEDVEAELKIRHNTARAHLRSMFVKAGVNRRAELVHLLANSLAPLGRRSQRSCTEAQSPLGGPPHARAAAVAGARGT